MKFTTLIVFGPVSGIWDVWSFHVFCREHVNPTFPAAIHDEKPDGTRTLRIEHDGRTGDFEAVWRIADGFEASHGVNPLVATTRNRERSTVFSR